MHGKNYNIMVITRLRGKVFHVLTFEMAKQKYSVKDERYFKAFYI